MGDSILFIILLAITVTVIAGLLIQALFTAMDAKKRALQQRLSSGEEESDAVYGPLIMEGNEAELSAFAARSALLKRFAEKLHRAYPGVVLGRFFFLVSLLAAFALCVGWLAMGSLLLGLVAAVTSFVIPFSIVTARCNKRLKVLDDQLPEALEFLARILRAGHSLTTGFQMAAEELPMPLAGEFRSCYDQHSLGTPLEDAMREMATRVGTSDFAFFVTAVLIQRQTGGDLAEVLTNIGNMIRARIRLQQHVKAITAEGRMVGYILLGLPVVFFFVLYALNPDYANVLLKTKEGSVVLMVAVMLQILGIVSIKKIVSVKM
jgi:tight adherence protein B